MNLDIGCVAHNPHPATATPDRIRDHYSHRTEQEGVGKRCPKEKHLSGFGMVFVASVGTWVRRASAYQAGSLVRESFGTVVSHGQRRDGSGHNPARWR